MSDVHPPAAPGPDLQIVRVLSNNAVLARPPADSAEADEVVLVGRGIGFQRRPGEMLPTDAAGRRYVELTSEQLRFLRSMDSLDHLAMDVITDAVDLAVDLLGELHPSVYVVLA